MKTIFLLLLLAPFQTFAIETDKAAHFGLMGVAHTTCTAIATKITHEKTWSNVGCYLGVNALGVAKELTDPSRGDKFEGNDILSNMLGSGLTFTVIQFGF